MSFIDPVNEKLFLGTCLNDPSFFIQSMKIIPPKMIAQQDHREFYISMIEIFSIEGEIETSSLALKNSSLWVAVVSLHVAPSEKKGLCNHLISLYQKRELAIILKETGKELSSNKPELIFHKISSKIQELQGAVVSPTSNLTEYLTNYSKTISEEANLLRQGKWDFEGVPTGFTELDDCLHGGFSNGHFVVIGGRSGTGKTSFMINSILKMLEKTPDKRVFIVSLEMNKRSIADRSMAIQARVDYERLRKREISTEEEEKCHVASSEWKRNVIEYGGPNVNTIEQLISVIKRMVTFAGVNVVYIDYLQRIFSEKKFGSNQERVAYVSSELKNLTLALNIPIVVLAQTNRKVDERTDKTPIITDLRDSGQIEQDSDAVLMLHNPSKFDETAPTDEFFCFVRKNRFGREEKVKLSADTQTWEMMDYREHVPEGYSYLT